MAIPNGDIILLRNVPLTATYEHTIDFKDKNEQYGYFYNFRKYVLEKYSYIRKEREYIAVELPLNDLDDINYLLFRSADGERLYYAFVTNKTYVNPTTSHIYYDIDVMQTYMFDYEWRASYIKQSHVDRWTAEHKPIYSKTDEGLDYGTEYSIENAYRLRQSEKLRWALITLKNYSALVSEGLVIDNTKIYPVATPFIYLLVPIVLQTLSGDDHTYNCRCDNYGAELSGIIGNVGTYHDFTGGMLNTALGDYVQSISIMPYNPFIDSEGQDGATYSFRLNIGSVGTVTFKDISLPFLVVHIVDEGVYIKKTLARADWDTGLETSLPTAEEWAEIKKNPRKTKRDKRFESKLLCAPYRYNLLTDWRNSPAIIKNEYMTTDKIEIMYSYALNHNIPFRYWVKDYKKDPEGRYTSVVAPLSLEMPIVSEAYYTYMLQNKNTIQANLTNAIISASTGVVSSAVSGAISGAGVGGVGGAVFSGITGAVGSAVSGAVSVSGMIRSENAKQADLKAVPTTIINSVDSSFNVNDNNTEMTFYRMRICCENEEIIAEIFNMSGYKVHRVEIPNTRSRVRFNYLQTVGANIVGSFNQNDILKIKEIYDRGITIWHYSEKDFYPLDYSYENIEVNLL